jgi:hypothetical protein
MNFFQFGFDDVVLNADGDGRGFALQQAGDLHCFSPGVDPQTFYLAIAGDQFVRPELGSPAGESVFCGIEHRAGPERPFSA